MPDTPTFLAERLKSEGEKTYAFFASLADEDWQSLVYTEGEHWTIRSVLTHYVTAERAFLVLFEDVRQGGPGASAEFSIDRYNASQQEKNKDTSPEMLLKKFEDVRSLMVDWVSDLRQEDLAKVGRHAYLGEATLAEMIKLVYRHNQIHYRDLRKVISTDQN